MKKLKRWCQIKGEKNKIEMIYERKGIEKLTIEGTISIAEKAGYFKKDQ